MHLFKFHRVKSNLINFNAVIICILLAVNAHYNHDLRFLFLYLKVLTFVL